MSKNEKRQFTKEEPVIFNPNEMYASMLEVPDGIKTELEAKGLVPRWINATELSRQFGFNKSGWKPYKPDTKVSLTGDYSGDPEGYLRRGDLILAVKSKTEHAIHKKKLQYKADLYKGYNTQKAQELRSFMRDAGIKTKVVEGYDEAGDADDEE